jgi:sulfhydrogenase subunit beta (sulfur reductase)
VDKILRKSDLAVFLEFLLSRSELIAPTSWDEDVIFRPVDDINDVVTDFTNSTLSPKQYFFPQTETLFEFSEKGMELELTRTDGIVPSFVVFGVRPCDIRSLILLDKVFSQDYIDPYYTNKRRRSLIIGMGCTQPLSTCFCTSFNYGPFETDGSDIFLVELEEKYIVRTLTPRGDRVVAGCHGIWKDVRDTDRDEMQNIVDKSHKDILLKVDVDGLDEAMLRSFDSNYWEDISRKCILCGVCTYVCPTCHCFDMVDEMRAIQGSRFRSWDSCMFAEFTKMAGGYNPRPSKKERVRQRFMHKLSYFQSRYGQYLCVGCGRCIEKCPVNMDISQVISDVKGVKVNA